MMLLNKFILYCQILSNNNGYIGQVQYVYETNPDEMNTDDMDEDGNPIVVESTSYSTKYTIWCDRNDVNTNPNESAWNIKVKWNTRSTSNLELPKGLIQYLANMYRLFTEEKNTLLFYRVQ